MGHYNKSNTPKVFCHILKEFDLKNYYSNEFQFNYGLNFIYYDFNPGTIGPLTADSGFNFSKLNKKFAFENSIYFDVLQKISNQFSMRYGIRINQFLRLRQNGLQKYIDNIHLHLFFHLFYKDS